MHFPPKLQDEVWYRTLKSAQEKEETSGIEITDLNATRRTEDYKIC